MHVMNGRPNSQYKSFNGLASLHSQQRCSLSHMLDCKASAGFCCRKSIQRKNKYGGTQPLEFTQKAFEPLSSDEPTLKLSAGDRISSTDELADKLSTADSTAATRSKSAAAAFDSTALEDHVASDFVHEQDVRTLPRLRYPPNKVVLEPEGRSLNTGN